MEIFRISREAHAGALLASGCANRWNLKGEQVIYAGSSRSLAALELAVHRGIIQPDSVYKMMVISVADEDHLVQQLLLKDLPANWRSLDAYPLLQKIGSAWYADAKSLVLKVPSAVIPAEYNYILNARHPDFFDKVKLVRTENYFWDRRLL